EPAKRAIDNSSIVFGVRRLDAAFITAEQSAVKPAHSKSVARAAGLVCFLMSSSVSSVVKASGKSQFPQAQLLMARVLLIASWVAFAPPRSWKQAARFYSATPRLNRPRRVEV